MSNEIIATGKTVEEAIENGCKQLGVIKDECDIQILQEDKKGFLGIFGNSDAKVKISKIKNNDDNQVKQNETKNQQNNEDISKEKISDEIKENNEKIKIAINYLTDILNKMNIENFSIETVENEKGTTLVINGSNLGVLIGRHGETLDSLQYLVSLVCNRIDGDYHRISLDCGNYREKRSETLKELAKKLSEKAKRTGRSQMLEAMNPYERRIIHAVVSTIEGVSSKSKGEEPYRKVVIIPNNKSNNYKKSYQTRNKAEMTMEEILKNDMLNDEKNSKLYSKIEL